MPATSDMYHEELALEPIAEHGYRPHTVSESVSSPPPHRYDRRSIHPRRHSTVHAKNIDTKPKWSTKKKIIVGAIVGGGIIALCAGIGLLVYFLVIKKSSDTTTTTTTSVPDATAITAYWPLDAAANDYYSVYNGTLMNSAGYFSTSLNQPYVGYGRGLALTATSSHYLLVSTPILDLSYRSFTIETWIYPTLSSSGDFGIFTQCQCSTCSNQCLYFIIRSYKLYLSFTNNDISGNTTLTTNTWYHVAFVYNNSTQQQILYVNGVQDGIKSSASPYQGSSGALWIGASQIYVLVGYFNGYIDNFRITTRAKSASQILTAATLIAYYPFDLPNLLYDSGPNGLNGSSSNTAVVTGRVNQAIRFTGASSYFQAYGFYQLPWAVTSNRPFSISFWINPTTTTTCTIVQISPYLSSYCNNFIGLYSYYSATAQVMVQAYYWQTIIGMMASPGTWLHISVTYSLTNGLTLYNNGIFMGTTGSFTFNSASGAISYFQLGYYTGCSYYNHISNTAYTGSMDEVYVHSRELTQSEVTALANP